MSVKTRSDRFFKLEAVTTPRVKRKLFDRIVAPTLLIEEAFLAILMGAARADGSVSPEESQEIAALTARTKTLSNLSVARVSELRRKIDDMIDRDGLDKVLGAACNSILHGKDKDPQQVRLRAESMLAHAVDLVFADRELHENEQEYIEELSRQLEIAEERVREIVSVIEIKNAF
jgi:tellurite resistance protein